MTSPPLYSSVPHRVYANWKNDPKKELEGQLVAYPLIAFLTMREVLKNHSFLILRQCRRYGWARGGRAP